MKPLDFFELHKSSITFILQCTVVSKSSKLLGNVSFPSRDTVSYIGGFGGGELIWPFF